MSVVTRDASPPAAFGAPETESWRGTRPLATAAVDLVREFPWKGEEPVRVLQGLSLTVAQGKVHGL
jgi:hypothetical protein